MLGDTIILNGIHDVIKNEDMLSRSIVFTLEKSENGGNTADEKVSLMEEFKKDCPAIWGGIVNLLSEAFGNCKPYIADRYGRDIRMPAFYDYGYCICEAWETGQGEVFCKRYGTLLDSQLKPFEKNPDLVELVVLFLERNNYEWDSKMQYFSGSFYYFCLTGLVCIIMLSRKNAFPITFLSQHPQDMDFLFRIPDNVKNNR